MRRCRLGVVLALAVCASAQAAAAHAHAPSSGDLGVRGVSEQRLRAFERAVLGAGHAAEHARARRVLRSRAGRARLARALRRARRPLARAAAAGPADQVGQWAAPFSIPVMAIHAAMLPTGKVLWFAYPKNPSPRHGGDPNVPNFSQAWLWDPATGATKRVDPPLFNGQPANIWCAGQSFLADGRVLVTGGNLAYSEGSYDFKGLNKVYTFNPFTETWAEQPDMRHGRWYPTQSMLADGRTLIVSGLDETGAGNAKNADVELFTPSPDLNGRGTISLLGVLRKPGDTANPGNPKTGGLYPHMFLMPSGRTLVAGPFPEDTWFLNSPLARYPLDWSEAADTARDRLWGTAVHVPGSPTKVMQLGGSAPPTVTSTTTDISVATTETFDESNAGAGWQAASDLNIGRGHANTVLLPDGSMVEVGGGVGIRDGDQWAADPEQRQVELWNPTTKAWRLGPAQAESRAYHSTALLLPDGRVVSAGDDVNGGTDRDTAEIYSPPYLFKGARPTISSAPGTIGYGANFDVGTPDANVTRAVLIAPGATTHANDMNQHYVPLTVTRHDGGVTLKAPANANLARPGYYMLFVLNDQGVPSVARFVRLGGPRPGGNLPPTAALTASPNPAAAGEAVTLDASGSTDPDGANLSYAWDLDGDGTFESSTGANPKTSATYAYGGSVALRVRVTDADGASADAAATLSVSGPRRPGEPSGGGTTGATGTGTGPDADTASPELTARVGRVRLRTALRRGVPVVVSCSEACSLTGDAYLAARAGRLRSTRLVRIGAGRAKLGGAGSARLVIRISRSGARRLAAGRTVRLRLRFTALDAAGNRRTLTRTLTLRR